MLAAAVPMLVAVFVTESEAQVKTPLLSAMFCPMALRIVETFDSRWVLRDWANWREGLMATTTIEAKMAMMPITTNNSIRVNPALERTCLLDVVIQFLFCYELYNIIRTTFRYSVISIFLITKIILTAVHNYGMTATSCHDNNSGVTKGGTIGGDPEGDSGVPVWSISPMS